MFKLASFVKETTDGGAEALTGVFALDGVSSAQFQDFVTGIGDGNTTIFEVTDGSKSEAWEGTVTDASPDTLTGTRWLGSTTGAQINWGAGVKTVTCGLDATDYLRLPGAADETELTISSGSVTPTRALHAVDTEADAGTDDLANALTASVRDGHIWYMRAANAARTVVVKNAAGGAGQFHLADNADFSLDDTDKWLLLVRRSTDWYEVARNFGADAAAARAFYGLGSAAVEDVGTATGDVVQLEDVGGSPGLPAVDGSQLTGINAGLDAASQAEMESASATDVAVTPGRQQFHPSAAKAWVFGDMGGTANASLNISSLTDVAVGKPGINFSTAFSSASYKAIPGIRFTSSLMSMVDNGGTVSASRCDILILNGAGTATDPNNFYADFHGDQ